MREMLMELKLADIWTAASILVGLQIGAFSWRVSREVAVASTGARIWFPLADIMNLTGMLVIFFGVFAIPLAGFADARIPQLAFMFAVVLFAGYPFAVAGHYGLLHFRGARSQSYAPRQEKAVIGATLAIAILFLFLALRATTAVQGKP
jgi:hypothetical protein